MDTDYVRLQQQPNVIYSIATEQKSVTSINLESKEYGIRWITVIIQLYRKEKQKEKHK